MKKTYSNVWWWVALVAAAFIAPSAVLADDTELFSTRANPNVLFMLDTTGSMNTKDPAVASGSIGDLDGDGLSDTRLDILYKVTYSLLNADLSIPSSTVSYQVSLNQQIKTTPTSYSQIQVSCGGSWSSFPQGPGTYSVTVAGPTEMFTYDHKSTSGSGSSKKCYLVLPSPKIFQSVHTSGVAVKYSVTTSYTTPYPSDHTQASGADYLNNLDNTDESLLKARMGVMRFKTNSTGTADGIDILNAITSTAPNSPRFNPTYQDIWTSIRGLQPGGGTPTAQALNAGLGFFNTAYNASEPCRKNFVIIITDGEDTAGLTGSGKTGGNLGSPYYYKSGSSYDSDYHSGWTFEADGWPGWPSNTGQVARNNQVIQAAAALKASSREVTVFSVGVGMSANQPHLRMLRHVLRRVAEQAGTTQTDAEYDAIGNGAEDNTIAAGKAFFATDATELADALHNIFQQITKGTFSYTAPTVLSVRAVDKNEVYTASFEPALPPNTLWRGHLKAYNYISADNISLRWDAAEVLKGTSVSNRNVLTSDNTWHQKSFDNVTILPVDLGLVTGDTANRNAIVNYVCGVGHTSSSDNNYILGDIFHSKPVLVGAPSKFYIDQGYREFANANVDRRRVLYAGANDGTLHAFLTGDWDNTTGKYSLHDTGAELFAYVPYHLLTEIGNYVPTAASSHNYFVDSSPRVADVWWDDNSDGIKQPSEWHTVLISGMRKGGASYFALDITNPPKSTTYSSYIDNNYPRVLWEYGDDTVLGETWSEPILAKVREKTSVSSTVVLDRFVAIFGGGRSDDLTIGNSLLVVDVKTGSVLKQFTGIDNQIVGSPTVVLDIQGYIRYIFATDLVGNLYKFDFRTVGDAYGSPRYSNWVGHKIFQPNAGGQPSYNRVEVATVSADGTQRYIYFGTGDREGPISNPNAGRFYMIIDDDTKTTATLESQLSNFTGSITSSAGGIFGSTTNKGWYVNLGNIVASSNMNDNNTHAGEKVLSDPAVFFNRVYFTTYTPDSTNPCAGGGISRIYGLDWFSGGAGMEPITASPNSETKTGSAPFVPSHVFAGKGLPSSPSLSINPWGQSSLFIGFSDATFTEITVASPPTSKKLRSWQEVN
jgi:type IV pilus assembly protein PilY1